MGEMVIVEKGKPMIRLWCHHLEMGVCFDCMRVQAQGKQAPADDDLARWDALFSR